MGIVYANGISIGHVERRRAEYYCAKMEASCIQDAMRRYRRQEMDESLGSVHREDRMRQLLHVAMHPVSANRSIYIWMPLEHLTMHCFPIFKDSGFQWLYVLCHPHPQSTAE
jgi:hypothetical protein